MTDSLPPTTTNSIANQRESQPESPVRKWASLVVLSLALAIIIIDTTLLNVSLRAIMEDLQTDLLHLQWVITAYALTLAALTITGGRVGDLYGKKKMFMVGAILFAIGSFIASVSPNVWVLILGESLIEGVGAALMLPATASLLVSNFHGRERAIAFGIWGGIAAASSAIGPLLGGFLTTYYSWRWGFRINVFVAAVLLLGSRLVKSYPHQGPRPQLDIVGVLLSALSLVLIVFGIIEASVYGWWYAKESFGVAGFTLPGPLSIVPYSITLGIALLGAFLLWERRRERRGQTPLVSLGIFRNTQFTTGVLTTAIFALSQAGTIFALPIYLQTVHGLDAFDTGLHLLPLSLAMLIVAPLSGVLARSIAPKHMILAGLIVNLGGVFLMRSGLLPDMIGPSLSWGLTLYGVGTGLIMAQVSNITLSAVPVQEAGEASGLNNTFRQIGQSLGSAIIGTVILSSFAVNIAVGIGKSSVIPSAVRAPLITSLRDQDTAMQFVANADSDTEVPEKVRSEVISIFRESMTNANRRAMIFTLVSILIGLVAALSLPGGKNVEQPKPSGGH